MGSSQDKVFHPPQNVQSSISSVRACLQVLIWRAADKTAPPEFTVNQSLSSFGWKMEEDILVSNHCCADIAPKSFLQLVACGCKSASPCSRSSCSCRASGLSCTTYCWCNGDEQCASYNTITQHNIAMAETDEANEDEDELAD